MCLGADTRRSLEIDVDIQAMSEDLEWAMQESIVDDFRELTYRSPIGCGCRF